MYNYNGRFFAFGCSFTASHNRPTWADIVGRQFTEYQNWARGGMGNQFIFNQLIEANLRNKFTSDDTIMIMWTSITREDSYLKQKNGWVSQGSVYTNHTTEWIYENACERGYLLRDLAVVAAAKDLLDHWGVKYEFLAMMPLVNPTEVHANKTIDKENKDIIDLYRSTLGIIKPSVFEIIFKSQNWNSKHSDFGAYIGNGGKRDPHPDPIEALEYIQYVLPELQLLPQTIDYVNDFKLGDDAPTFYHVTRF